MRGAILVSVSDGVDFLSEPKVPLGIATALASIMQVPVAAMEVDIRSRRRRLQAADALTLRYVVTIEGPNATQEITSAKLALIRATPQQIAELLRVEVEALVWKDFGLVVLEVEPPIIEGVGKEEAQIPDNGGGAGVVFDPDDTDLGRRPFAMPAVGLCILLLLA